MYYAKTYYKHVLLKYILQAQKGKPFKIRYMTSPWDSDVNETDNLIIEEILRITTEEEIESIGLEFEHRKELEEDLKTLLSKERYSFYYRYKNIKDEFSYGEDIKDLYEVLRTDKEWRQEVIDEYCLENGITYKDVTLENRDIARLYASKGFPQEEFNKAINRQKKLGLDNSKYIEFCNFCIENGIAYEGVTTENKELAKLCTKYELSQNQFNTASLEFEQKNSDESRKEYLQICEICLENGITYDGVTTETEELAKFFNDYGVNQTSFNDAVQFRQQALELGIPEHVLGEEIKEEPALLNIEEIREQTRKKIKNVETMLQENFNEQFSYEWLRKNDPHNWTKYA